MPNGESPKVGIGDKENTQKGEEAEKGITLKPGETGVVDVAYEVRGSGAVQETVTLKTNDPCRPVVYLTLRGTVPQNLQVMPASLTFVNEKGKAGEKTVTVLGPSSMDIAKASTDNPSLKATTALDKADEAGKAWKVQVALSEDAPVGELKATLTIKTTHPERPTITIPITAFIRGDLELRPATAFFGFVKTGAKETRTMTLSSRSGKAFRLLKVQIDNPKVQVSHPTQRKDGGYDLTVTLDTKAPAFIDAKLKVHTDVKGEEALPLPVTALIE